MLVKKTPKNIQLLFNSKRIFYGDISVVTTGTEQFLKIDATVPPDIQQLLEV